MRRLRSALACIFTVIVVTGCASTEDRVWEIDGYHVKDGNGDHWMLHAVCPKCDRTVTIRSDKKAVEIDEAEEAVQASSV